MAQLFSVAKAIILPSNSTQPVELGVLQEVSLDFSIDKKELQGQNRYSILTVQGKGSVSGKASMGRFNAELISALLGAKKTSGAKLLANELATIPATSTYTVTVTNSAKFSRDCGVILVGASELYNVPMKKVTTTPNAGEYSVTSGVYTFSSADKSKNVLIDYEYTTTTGSTLTLPNPVMGDSYPFSLWTKTQLQDKEVVIKLPNVISGKFSMPLKLGEFSIPDFDFDVFADGAGNIGYMYTSD